MKLQFLETLKQRVVRWLNEGGEIVIEDPEDQEDEGYSLTHRDSIIYGFLIFCFLLPFFLLIWHFFLSH